MAQVKFYILRRKDKDGNLPIANLPILCKYSFNGQRLEYYTGERCELKWYNKGYWKKGKNPVSFAQFDGELINQRLDAIERHIKTIETEAIQKGLPLTARTLRAELDKRLKPADIKEKPTLLQYFDIYIKELASRVNERTGVKLSKAMSKKYGTIKNLFMDFCYYKKRQYNFEDINSTFYNDFKAYMIFEKKYSVNTYGRSIKFLKTILNDAAKNGYNEHLEFRTILKGAAEESDNIYLNKDELQKLYKYDFSESPKLDRVRDFFLIGCWTGLRFSDFTTIKKEDIQGNRIRVKTQKTRQKVVIPLHPVVRAILKKYNYELPPPISNQKFNKYIKDAARLAEISTPFIKNITKGGKVETIINPKSEVVSSHAARRSFASNSYIQGIPIILIMAITGHRTETEFMKYIKLSADEKADQFEQQAGWKI
jgi:integrase